MSRQVKRFALPLLVLATLGLVPVLASDGDAAPAGVIETEASSLAIEIGPAAAPEAAVCTAQETALGWLEETSCCISQCRRDKDCNAVCAPFGGRCVQVNSCCRECACFG